jgi:hypothetical protein
MPGFAQRVLLIKTVFRPVAAASTYATARPGSFPAGLSV